MREAGLHCFLHSEEFETHGFSDILLSLPKLRRQFFSVRNTILETKPNGVIFIDYPGFNLRMAKALRKKGFEGKLIQYVSPTVWAWGKQRIDQMSRTLDLLMTIYPFEANFFKGTPLNVRYVGNPIQQQINQYDYDANWTRLFGIKEADNLIALFPGSRKTEIQLNLPYQIKAAKLIKKKYPKAVFVISCAHEKIIPSLQQIFHDNSLKLNQDVFLLPKGYAYELMKDCYSAIATSGTVTLELALHQRPTVVIYKLTWLNRLIAKHILRLRLPYYCIVNILKEKTVFPELIEKGLNPQNIFRHFNVLYQDSEARKVCIKECGELPSILKLKDGSVNAANSIMDVLS